MSDKNWTVELEKLDYQGFYKKDDKGKEKKVVGRNHLLLVANGYVGVRGCLGELFDDKMDSSIHVIGIYDQVGYDDPSKDIWKEIINMPDFMSVKMSVDGEQVFLNREGDNFSDFRVWVDMKTATQYLQYTWKSKKGAELKVELSRFCAYHNKNLVYNKVKLTSLKGDIKLSYQAGITGDVHDANGIHLENFRTNTCEGGYILTANTQQHKYKVAISSRHSISGNPSGEIVSGEQEVSQTFSLDLKKDESLEVTSQHALFTSRDSMDPVADALRAKFDYSTERKAHEEMLGKHWEIANVEIETDEEYIDTYLKEEIRPVIEDRVEREVKFKTVAKEKKDERIESELSAEVQRVKKSELFMRYNLYILLISIPKDYDYASIPSRSLSYSTYKGAIFWEVDTYAFPFYALVYPQYARNLLQYRFKALEYAIKKASDLGFDGAFFAWESLDTGEEATKQFVWQDIHSKRMLRNFFGDRQWHIAGDVIYAAWQYYDLTGDWEFMQEYGAQMTLLSARFVGSLVYYKVPLQRYEILHTCCPDEYHEEVANNAFTNRVLRYVLEKSFDLLELMEERAPEKLEKLMLNLKITEGELEYWQDIIEKMYIPEPHSETKVIEQHDGYFELEDITIEEFKSRIIRDEYLGYPIGPAVHTQIIKQADTVQMLVMFKKEFHPIVRLATFDYYDLRTEHGSGDSPNAYGIVAAQVGRLDRALWYFLRSARIDLESTNPAKKANFQLGGVHIAPSGGTWQVIHYGFAGFEQDGHVLNFNPIVPKGWNSVKYNFHFQGNLINVALDRTYITLRSSDDNEDLDIRINDNAIETLEPGKELKVEYRKMGNHYYTYNDLGIQIQDKS